MPVRSQITTISILCIVAGIFSFHIFRALPSIGLGVLLVLASVNFKQIKSFVRQKAFLVPSFIYLIYLISLIKTEAANTDSINDILIFFLPYLIFPLAFSLLPRISTRQLNGFYYFFLWLAFLSAMGTTINFLLHFDEITASYIHSKVMPTPVNHVRYSIIIAFSIFTGGYLFLQNFTFKYAWEKTMIGAMTIFLFSFIHILSVRSGLLSLYAGIFLIAVYIGIKKKKYKLLALVTAGLIALPLLTYIFVPTFSNKVQNTLADLKQIGEKGSAKDYSMAGRIVSYKVAWEVFTDDPITGSGIANLKAKVHKIYHEKYPEIVNQGIGILMPHNQFLYVMAATGIMGLIAFLICFYFPLLLNSNASFPLLSIHYLIVTISFVFEATMETQTGLLFVLTFLFLPLFHLKEKVQEA